MAALTWWSGGIAAQSAQPNSAAGAVVGGVVGAGIGAFGGILVGVAVGCGGNGCSEDLGFLGPAIAGLTVGESLMLPLGVHLGNRAAGNLADDVVISLGVGTGTMLLALATESGAVLAVGGLAQLGLTVWAERSAGGRTGRELTMRTRLLPDGRVGIGLNVRH